MCEMNSYKYSVIEMDIMTSTIKFQSQHYIQSDSIKNSYLLFIEQLTESQLEMLTKPDIYVNCSIINTSDIERTRKDNIKVQIKSISVDYKE